MFKNNRDFRLSSLESDSEYMECILEICIFLISSPGALVSWPYLENTGQNMHTGCAHNTMSCTERTERICRLEAHSLVK